MVRTQPGYPAPRKPAKKPLPFPFILEALASLDPVIRPMFGGHAVYFADKVVFMLRNHHKSPQDNGLWIVFAEGFDPAKDLPRLHKELPSLRTIDILQGAIKHWFVLPADSPGFETEALRVCDLVLARDSRIGRVPKSRR